MFLVSDLDNTLIYSHQLSGVCVERLGERPITFMTERAVELLHLLLQKDNFCLVPCTLRSYEQTMRIDFVKEGLTPFLICDNGYSFYRNGKLDLNWDEKMKRLIDTSANLILYQQILDIIRLQNIPVKLVKSNRDAFYTIVFPDIETATHYATIILSALKLIGYKSTRQGRKLYIIPQFLDKSLAVAYLRNLYLGKLLVTAGDSDVDIQFVKQGDILFIPRHSSIVVDGARTTDNSGIMAGEEILQACFQMQSNL